MRFFGSATGVGMAISGAILCHCTISILLTTCVMFTQQFQVYSTLNLPRVVTGQASADIIPYLPLRLGSRKRCIQRGIILDKEPTHISRIVRALDSWTRLYQSLRTAAEPSSLLPIQNPASLNCTYFHTNLLKALCVTPCWTGLIGVKHMVQVNVTY